MVELCESPINQSQLAISMVYHDIVGFHIAVHDALRVAEVECFQNLKHIEADIKVSETFIERAEVVVTSFYVLHNQGRRFSKRVTHDINKVDNVNSATNCLQDFDLSSDFCLLNRLEDFDYYRFVVLCVNTSINL